MKLYYVKVGKMYVEEIYVDNETIETNFVFRMNLRFNNIYAIKIKANEKEKWLKLLTEILGLENNSSIIFEETFEETIESEEN